MSNKISDIKNNEDLLFRKKELVSFNKSSEDLIKLGLWNKLTVEVKQKKYLKIFGYKILLY